MEFKFGKEMHFIVYIEVADKTLYFAGRVVLFNSSQWVQNGCIDRCAGIVERFVIAAEV